MTTAFASTFDFLLFVSFGRCLCERLQQDFQTTRGRHLHLRWAPWHPPSVHLTKVLEAVAKEQKSTRFAKAWDDKSRKTTNNKNTIKRQFMAHRWQSQGKSKKHEQRVV